VDGQYLLMDPTETNIDDAIMNDRGSDDETRRRKRAEYENIRMPPSLTLSKIRSVKQSALLACIRAKIEVSTVALACVYFERLALDCRVDKSNRRLTFASCILIAIKINESNVKIVHEESSKESSKKGVLKNWKIKPRDDNDFFASLFFFFTHDWELPLKKVFAAEWGVFAALGFKLHASPIEVSFHFKRLMKSLEWSPLDYLGPRMYDYWQDALTNESIRKKERAERRERRRKQRDKKILKLQRELQDKETAEFTNQRRRSEPVAIDAKSAAIVKTDSRDLSPKSKRKSGMRIFSRIGRRTNDLETISIPESKAEKKPAIIHRSISSPTLSTKEIGAYEEEISHTVHGVHADL